MPVAFPGMVDINGIHVENPNGAFTLYESVGFRQTRLDTLYRKPMD